MGLVHSSASNQIAGSRIQSPDLAAALLLYSDKLISGRLDLLGYLSIGKYREQSQSDKQGGFHGSTFLKSESLAL